MTRLTLNVSHEVLYCGCAQYWIASQKLPITPDEYIYSK